MLTANYAIMLDVCVRNNKMSQDSLFTVNTFVGFTPDENHITSHLTQLTANLTRFYWHSVI